MTRIFRTLILSCLLAACGGTTTPDVDGGAGTDAAPVDTDASTTPDAGAPLAHYTQSAGTATWIDACAMGTDLMPSNTDENTVTVDLDGFEFLFFGEPITMLRASTNGWLSFSQFLTDSAPRHESGRLELPTEGAPNAAIYALWEDLRVADTDGLCAGFTTGASRTLVVQWQAAFTQSGGDLGDLEFQVQMTEGTNEIQILWQTADAGTATARLAGSTIGLENEGMVGSGHPGTEAVIVEAVPTSGASARFVPSL